MILVRISDNERELDALWNVLEYLSKEKQDYEEQGRPRGHIWEEVQTLAYFHSGVRGNLQALNSHLETIAKTLRREGTRQANNRWRTTVKDGDGRINLIWVAEKKKGRSNCKAVEKLIPCEDCE